MAHGRIRFTRQCTQDGLCGRLSVVTEGRWVADRQEIGRIENGSRYVTTLELAALARVLDVTIAWIMEVDGADARSEITR